MVMKQHTYDATSHASTFCFEFLKNLYAFETAFMEWFWRREDLDAKISWHWDSTFDASLLLMSSLALSILSNLLGSKSLFTSSSSL